MARKSNDRRIAVLSACVTALSQTVLELCNAIEVCPEAIVNRLNVIQEMAYSATDTAQQREFGLSLQACMLVINAEQAQQEIAAEPVPQEPINAKEFSL